LVGRNRLGLDADNTPSSNINQALHNPAHHIAMKERSYKTCSMITSGNHDTTYLSALLSVAGLDSLH
jgi:hypothetical protein